MTVIIWTGRVDGVNLARIVAEQNEGLPLRYTYEAMTGRDAMGNETWHQTDRREIWETLVEEYLLELWDRATAAKD